MVTSRICCNLCREISLLLSLVYFLVGWHAGAVSLPLVNVISVQLACPLSDVLFLFRSGITNLSPFSLQTFPMTLERCDAI